MRASDLRARLIAGRSPAYGMAEVRRLWGQGRPGPHTRCPGRVLTLSRVRSARNRSTEYSTGRSCWS